MRSGSPGAKPGRVVVQGSSHELMGLVPEDRSQESALACKRISGLSGYGPWFTSTFRKITKGDP